MKYYAMLDEIAKSVENEICDISAIFETDFVTLEHIYMDGNEVKTDIGKIVQDVFPVLVMLAVNKDMINQCVEMIETIFELPQMLERKRLKKKSEKLMNKYFSQKQQNNLFQKFDEMLIGIKEVSEISENDITESDYKCMLNNHVNTMLKEFKEDMNSYITGGDL